MTYLNILELIVLVIGTVAIPVFLWAFTIAKKNQEAQRATLLKEVSALIAEHFISLESLIKANRQKIERMKLETKHSAELSCIQTAQQDARIADLENYLTKHDEFQLRTRPQIPIVSDLCHADFDED